MLPDSPPAPLPHSPRPLLGWELSESGGTGRRARLRIWYPKGYGGSSPSFRTTSRYLRSLTPIGDSRRGIESQITAHAGAQLSFITRQTQSGRLSCRLWFGLFGLAALPRGLYLVVMRPAFEPYHWEVSDSLLQHDIFGINGIHTSLYQPLYPLFLAATRLLSRDNVLFIQAAQLAIDSVGAVAIYLLAEALTHRRRIALFSAVLYAMYPLLIRHSVGGNEFSLLSVLLIAFAYAVITATTVPRAATAGLLLGVAMLTRATIAPLLLLVPTVLMISRRRAAAIVLAVTAATVITPWQIRNYAVTGAMWPTRSGDNLRTGNSRDAATLLPKYNMDLSGEYVYSTVERDRPELLDPTAEVELDRFITGLMLRKAVYFFWPRLVPSHVMVSDTRVVLEPDGRIQVVNSPPRPLIEEVAYSTSYCFVAATAVVGIWLRRRHLRRDAVLWCIVLVFVAVHTAYFPATRYRTSMEFVLLFYAAVGLDSWVGARASRFRT